MPDVTKLKKVKKNYEVTFRDMDAKETVTTVSEDLVVSYRLVKGKVLDQDTWTRFLSDCVLDKPFQKAKTALCRGPKSQVELDKLLAPFALTGEEIDTIIRKLSEQGLFDEPRFSRELVDKMAHDHQMGQEKIRFILVRKGYPSPLIEAALATLSFQDTWASLERLFEKKLAQLKPMSIQKATQTLKTYLLGRGYSIGDVIRFIAGKESLLRETIPQTKGLLTDYPLVKKKYSHKLEDPKQIRQKIIQALLQKGYPYQLIIQVMEGGRL
jgi:regulatory protein